MRIKTITLYSFDELSEQAQEKALNKLWDINVDFEWWDSIYEDARNIGIEITSFDTDRPNYCNGKFVQDAIYTASKIISEHGEQCETYKTAVQFQTDRDEIVNNAPKDENGDFEDEYEVDQLLSECENEFLESILEDYLTILKSEYEYQTTKKAVIETIESNEYEFTEDGELS